MHVKKGDKVLVRTGKNKGKTGTIVKVVTETGRVVIEGVNVVKKHIRARQSGSKGQTIEIALPIHASNVSPLDPKSNKPTRVGAKVVDGKRVRTATKSGQELK